MSDKETIDEFYKKRSLEGLKSTSENPGQFNVFRKSDIEPDKQAPRYAG